MQDAVGGIVWLPEWQNSKADKTTASCCTRVRISGCVTQSVGQAFHWPAERSLVEEAVGICGVEIVKIKQT